MPVVIQVGRYIFGPGAACRFDSNAVIAEPNLFAVKCPALHIVNSLAMDKEWLTVGNNVLGHNASGEFDTILQLPAYIRCINIAALEFNRAYDEGAFGVTHEKQNAVASLTIDPMSGQRLVRVNQDTIAWNSLHGCFTSFLFARPNDETPADSIPD